MTVSAPDRAAFFADVEAASQNATYAALATVEAGEPRVRIVHPTWEGDTLWFATFTGSAKHRQLEATPTVELQFQVAAPEFIHVVVRGQASVESDAAERARIWDVIDYDLSAFWSGGPTDESYTAVRVAPERVELSKLYGTQDRRVWQR